jgi:MscS family membrane protein
MLLVDPLSPVSPGSAVRRLGGVGRVVAVVIAAVVVVGILPGPGAWAQENPLEPLDTSSPQATYLSFVEQVDLLEGLLLSYEANRTEANQAAYDAALGKVEALFDFSEVSEANEGEVLVVTFARMADILNRIPPPDVGEIPDADDVAAADEADGTVVSGTLVGGDVPVLTSVGGIADYTLPGTEITITRIEEGTRAGDYVFSADTVSHLAEWREDVEDLPVNAGVEVLDWVQEDADFTGHLVPRSLVDALPDALDRDFIGSPLWKLVVDLVILGLVATVVVAWHRTVGRRGEPGTPRGYLFRLTTPVLMLGSIGVARRFMDEQVNHSGEVATIVNLVVTLVVWASLAWGFWLLTKLVVEWVIATPTISDDSIDAHLLRLLGKVVSVVGAFALAWIGLSRVGVPTISLGIGAGVAGLAVALAATSTLENLLGGITVYIDKPFRVGDKIALDDDFGTVEAIGPRSTRIRRLDDTQVTLPNSDISRAKVTNYSERHFILFVHVVGVRYETTVEQLQAIVEAIDARFRAHPLVLDEADYPRVRVSGFGSSSIDIEVRAHVDTDDFGVFTGVQQQLLLLIYEIVEATGSGFAFPSSTTYLADDTGIPGSLDRELLTAFGRRPEASTTRPVLVPVPADRESAGLDDEVDEDASD